MEKPNTVSSDKKPTDKTKRNFPRRPTLFITASLVAS